MKSKEPEAAPAPKPEKRILKPGYKLPDGLVLQRETAIEYVTEGDAKRIVGPADVRPRILLGTLLDG